MISSGARGQGAVEAKLFAKEGARVVIGDILEDEGRQIEAELKPPRCPVLAMSWIGTGSMPIE